MTPSQALIAAKKLIDTPKKWCKGSFDDGDKHCPIGATLTIAETLKDKSPAYRARSYLIKAGITTSWNDAPERTHAEVMEAFNKAIKLAEQDEQ